MDYSFAHPLLVLKVFSSLQKHRDSLGCKLYQPDSEEPERTRNLWDGIIQTGFVHGCVHLLLNSSSDCCYHGTKGTFLRVL